MRPRRSQMKPDKEFCLGGCQKLIAKLLKSLVVGLVFRYHFLSFILKKKNQLNRVCLFQSLPRLVTLNEDLTLSMNPFPGLASLRNASYTFNNVI